MEMFKGTNKVYLSYEKAKIVIDKVLACDDRAVQLSWLIQATEAGNFLPVILLDKSEYHNMRLYMGRGCCVILS